MSHCGSLLLLALAACGSTSTDADGGPNGDASIDDAASDAATSDGTSDAPKGDGGPCTTRIQYGSAWMPPVNHPNDFDVVDGLVTWDGTCTDDGKNSFALLSNGSKPYFSGHSACIIALDRSDACGAPIACATRVGYGAGWAPPANHPATYDDFTGRVFGDGVCHEGTYADLSSGDQPHFSGGTCPLSFSYTQCGGLYTNPTIPSGCADPGVLRDDDGTYVLSCTSGAAANAFPIYTSPDLAHWKHVGFVFPQGKHPSWSTGNAFWAREIHKVGTHYVAYFSAENTGGLNAVGAASSPSATGPFTDVGAPLVKDSTIGVIDASEINTSSNTSFLIWKVAGLAVNKPTPIHSQRLSADGLSVSGALATLVTNDQAWEGPSTEGPFMIERNGMFYLFYSGGVFSNATYAVGVEIGNTGGHGIELDSGSGLATKDLSSDFVLMNSHVHDTALAGIKVTQSQRIYAIGNEFAHTGPGRQCTEFVASDMPVIVGNDAHDADAFDEVKGGAHGGIIARNRIHDMHPGGGGILVGGDCTGQQFLVVWSNVISGADGFAFRVVGCHDCTVASNTYVGQAPTAILRVLHDAFASSGSSTCDVPLHNSNVHIADNVFSWTKSSIDVISTDDDPKTSSSITTCGSHEATT